MKKTLIIFLLFFSNILFSRELMYLARSPQALLMGDAFTAVADDEYTLFYNPAALGRNKSVSFTPFSPTLGLSDPLSANSKFTNFPSTASGIANKIMDYPIYIQLSAIPTIKMAQFSMSLFANQQTSMTLRNATHPMLDLKSNYDRGFIAGFAFNLGDGATSAKKSKKAKSQDSVGQRLSVGFALKHFNREGLDGQFDLFGTKLLNTINSGNASASSFKQALGYSKGDAWGYDLGAEYARSSGASTFTAGYSLLDVFGTRFSKTSGSTDLPKQPMIANAGVAFKQDFGAFDYTLSADMHPVLGSVDFMRQMHLGARLGLPFVTAFGGMSEGYLSYGASINLFIFDFTAGWYGVEIGTKFRQEQAKRFILYLSLFDFSFDL